MIVQIIKNICNNAYKQIDGEKCTIIIDELDIDMTIKSGMFYIKPPGSTHLLTV